MWGQQPRWPNSDSDQSISDEEEESGHHWPANCVSLAASVQKKQGSEILSRLELLKGTRESVNEASNFSQAKQRIPILEDDIEIPNFHDEDDFICPQKAVIADIAGKKIYSPDGTKEFPKDARVDKQGLSYSWSSASKEAEALAHFGEQASSHTVQKKSSKGVKGKGKPRFSFRFQSLREGPSSPYTLKDENNLAINKEPEPLDAIISRSELAEEIQDEEENLPEVEYCGVEALKYECRVQPKSIADLFDTSFLHPENLKKRYNKRRKRLQIVKSYNPQVGDQIVSREDSPDIVDSSESASSESESNIEKSDKDGMLAIPDTRRKTIVDQFQDAFGDTFPHDSSRAHHSMSKAPRSGLFWRMQQVILNEKERETDFLQKIGNEKCRSRIDLDKTSCMNVKVLSRHLEAKLTVCHCFVSDKFENPLDVLENERSQRTIIFDQRVSVEVDLEVGNYVRIHPPWKEVQVSSDECIILATYFSNF